MRQTRWLKQFPALSKTDFDGSLLQLFISCLDGTIMASSNKPVLEKVEAAQKMFFAPQNQQLAPYLLTDTWSTC